MILILNDFERDFFKLVSNSVYGKTKLQLVAVHKNKELLTLNELDGVGMYILNLSKTLIYNFHYNYIKRVYSHKTKLLFTD